MEKDIKKTVILFMISYLFMFIAQACSYCFLINYLTSLNYGAVQRSIIMTIGSIISIFIQILFGYLSDRNKKMKVYCNILIFIFSIVSFCLYFFTYNSFIEYLIVGSIYISIFRSAMSTVDNWVMESGNDIAINFGPIRAFGSIGWAIGSTITGNLVSSYGYQGISYLSIIFSLLALITNLFISDAQKRSSEKIRLKDTLILFSNKRFILVVLILFLLFFVQSSLDVTIVDKFLYLNASDKATSLYWSITAILELPLFFLGFKIQRKFSSISLLMFAALIYGVRFVMYGLAANVWQMLLISALQICSFPLINIASKRLVINETPDNLKSSGMQIGGAIYSTTSSLLSPIMAAYCEEQMGINITLLITALFAFASLLLSTLYVNKNKNAN